MLDEKIMIVQAQQWKIIKVYMKLPTMDVKLFGNYYNDAVLMNKVAGYDITNDVIEGLNARYQK